MPLHCLFVFPAVLVPICVNLEPSFLTLFTYFDYEIHSMVENYFTKTKCLQKQVKTVVKEQTFIHYIQILQKI